MTTRGTPCPDCVRPKGARGWKPQPTEHVALVANELGERYSVCPDCHARQVKAERRNGRPRRGAK